MIGHDIVVVGASAGGVEALTRLVRTLPEDLPATLFVVLHLPADGKSHLPQILTRSGPLLASHPADGETIQQRRIYVAPPDHHLVVGRGYVRVIRGPKENGYRPAVDTLFRSAARAYGRRVVGVVLSGSLDDGTAGLQAVKMHGGVGVVQTPDDALFAGMPTSALENVPIDHCLGVAEIGPLLVRLASQPVETARGDSVADELDGENPGSEHDHAFPATGERPGTVSAFTCPECHGTLWEAREGQLLRFQCRVGHAFSGDSLLAQQAEALEAALWTALRALEEKAALARRLTKQANERNLRQVAGRFEEQERDARQRAAIIREALRNGEESLTEDDLASGHAPEPSAGTDGDGLGGGI